MRKTEAYDVILLDGQKVRHAAKDQIFTFTGEDGIEMTLSVLRLTQLHAAQPQHWEELEIAITAADAGLIAASRGIDVKHVECVHERAPGYGCFLEDGTFLLVDGNHRYVRRYRLGLPFMRVFACRPPHWHGARIDMAATAELWGRQA